MRGPKPYMLTLVVVFLVYAIFDLGFPYLHRHSFEVQSFPHDKSTDGNKLNTFVQRASLSAALKDTLPAPLRQHWRFGQGSILVAISTVNSFGRTYGTLVSLAASNELFDVMLFDDMSDPRVTREYDILGVKYVQPFDRKAHGLTYQWNTAYKHFKAHSEYEMLAIINNDVLIPTGTLSKLLHAVNLGWTWVYPVSTHQGFGRRDCGVLQSFHTLTNSDIHATEIPLNFQTVATSLTLQAPASTQIADVKVVSDDDNTVPLGYFMCFGRNIIRAEYQSDTLFDPSFINAGNEDELANRIATLRLKIGAVTNAFVYHFKGSTMRNYKASKQHDDRNDVVGDEWSKMKDPYSCVP